MPAFQGQKWLVMTALIAVSCIATTGCHSSGPAMAGSTHRPSESATPGTTPSATTSIPSVQTIVPERRHLVSQFEQPGVLEAVEEAELFSRVSGYVKSHKVDIGDRVHKGDVLLEVDVPELAQELAYKEAMVQQAEAELIQAKANVDTAQGMLNANQAQVGLAEADVAKAKSDREFRQREYDRYASLAASNAATKQLADEKENMLQSAGSALRSAEAKQRVVEVDESVLKSKLAAARADVTTKEAKITVAKADREKTRILFEYAQLKAPFDGVITRRTVDAGDYVSSPGSDRASPLFTLKRIDMVTAVLRVPEKDVPAIRVGNPASIKLAALSGQALEGRISRMSMSVDDKSLTMRVEIDLPNSDGKLYPGMYGKVQVTLADLPDALTVPASALYGSNGELFVVTVDENKTRRIKVRTGYDNGSVVQILDGLQGNEQVVVSNKGDLTDGQIVRTGDHAS